MLKATFVAAMIALCFTSVAQAQRTEVLSSGMRVRLSRDSGQRVSGTIVRITRDSIYLSDGSNESAATAVVRNTVRTVELSAGKSRLTGSLKGAGLAVFMGGALGALYGSLQPKPVERQQTTTGCFFGCSKLTYTECVSHCGNMGPVSSAFSMAFLALPVGAVTGAIMGSERWASLH